MTRMRRARGLRVVLVVVLLVAPLAPVALHGGPNDSEGLRDPVEQLREGFSEIRGREPAPEPVSAEVLVTVKLRGNATLPADRALEVRRTYSREGATLVEGYVPLTAVRDLSTRPAVESVRMESAADPGGHVAAGVGVVGAGALHERGVTGENVTVGIIDSEFRVSDPELAGHVAAYRSFGATGDPAHGTAVASVVTDTAPGVELHLAAVGSSTSEAEYREAVDWLHESGADIVVDAGSYFGRQGDGTDPLASVATNASEDVLFVTSAGNYGQRHWGGVHEGAGWVSFAPGTEGNVLAGGDIIGGQVRASLRWTPGPNASEAADYDLFLFRRGVGGPSVVAKATADNDTAAHIDATVPRGRYYLAVRASNVDRPHRLELFASRNLTHRVVNGSITTPAGAPGVVAVGAYDRNDDDVTAFSSRGPAGNRTGVDLVAPDSVVAPGTGAEGGTSFAAPYVAGTAALLQSEYPSMGPEETRTLLRASARDVGQPGPDVAAGHGLLDAQAAAELARERARFEPVEDETDSGVAVGAPVPFQPPRPAVALAAETALVTVDTNTTNTTGDAPGLRPTGASVSPGGA